ncbi:MAG: hypothetical protein ABGW88_02230 [Leeuwenhoekiella sp.]|uniref:hypothetical protein n=1 Tax=Leeuwenhoekiella sp. TaxID=1977054 RepID=UPI003241BE3D|tara:strand:- start:1488 stop:2291 length:804 start_codon:yes stop_codon:yes gene_type:complete
MKTTITSLFLLFTCFVVAQDIVIDFSRPILVQEQLVSRGEHTIQFKPKGGFTYAIKMTKETNLLGSLFIPDPSGTAGFVTVDGNSVYQNTLKFKDNTKYSFEVLVTDTSDGSTETLEFILMSQSDFSWATTIGFNAIFLSNNTLYRSLDSDGMISIVEDGGQKTMDLVPSVMFTYAKFGNDFAIGPTAGLGFDLDNISVFGGASLGIGQNFILTAGLALHKQDKLEAQFVPGQTLDNALSFDDLHEGYYRINPFISLALRLDKNPFK